MKQAVRAGSGGVWSMIISACLFGCSHARDPAPLFAGRLAALTLAGNPAADGASDGRPTEAAGGAAAELACRDSDASCDGVDDDCDGLFDEDFTAHCMFESVALRCENGIVTSQVCDDGDPCTLDRCGERGCQRMRIDCDDEDPCTVDSCDPGLGCRSEPVAGRSCDDGDACSVTDQCDDAGRCLPGAALAIDDRDPCTRDSCDPRRGAVHSVVSGTRCDDGDLCSEDDVCDAAGSCKGKPLALDDGDVCTEERCDPETGAVTHPPLPEGASCADGNACNGEESCALTPQRTLSVSAKQTFLRSDASDSIEPPISLALAELGLGSGSRIGIFSLGKFAAPPASAVFAIFSRDSRLLDRGELRRIPGGVQSEAPSNLSGPTYTDNLSTDVPEDFRLDASELQLAVPDGASHLFLGNIDSYYADNAGELQVVVHALGVPCEAAAPLNVDDGNPCTTDACDPASGVSHPALVDGSRCELQAGQSGTCRSGTCER